MRELDGSTSIFFNLEAHFDLIQVHVPTGTGMLVAKVMMAQGRAAFSGRQAKYWSYWDWGLQSIAAVSQYGPALTRSPWYRAPYF